MCEDDDEIYVDSATIGRFGDIVRTIEQAREVVVHRTAVGLPKKVSDIVDGSTECSIGPGEHLLNLTRTQTRLFMLQNNLPVPPKDRALDKKFPDNFYSAKRYIGYLIALRLLDDCGKGDKCPFSRIPSECVEYLQSLSVEEFVKTKAYLIWRDRTPVGVASEASQADEDYRTAEEYLDQRASGACCVRKAEKLDRIRRMVTAAQYFDDWPRILAAKVASFKRRFPNAVVPEDTIDRYVGILYSSMKALLADVRPSKEEAMASVRALYCHVKHTNMFEFIFKCSLVGELSHDEHNKIRSALGKGEIQVSQP
jgi:hypothetical protein